MARPAALGQHTWRPIQHLTSVLAVSTVLAVAPAYASPKIDHTPPKPASGEDLTIRAKIAGADGDVFEPYLCYRTSGPTYAVVPLKHQSGSDYEAVIPSDALTGVKFEYYLGAYDSKDLSEATWRSPANPQKLALPIDEEAEHVDKVGKAKKKKEEKAAKSKHKTVEDVERAEASVARSTPDAAPTAPKVAADDPKKHNFDDLPPLPTGDDATAPAPAPPAEKPAAPAPAPAPPAPAPTAAPAAVASADAPVVPPPPPPKPAGPPILVQTAVPPPAGLAAGSGFIRFVSEPSGATINIDGTDLGTSPMKKTMPEGDVLVMVRLTGYKQVSKVVNIKAAAGKEAKFTLTPG